ncbi:MAG TPA: 2Fe-2S iron-sulfur cluster-binding protein [bacterium]|nr:2Fe-2S iron-sulfur cluster-binding protein [bacterium]
MSLTVEVDGRPVEAEEGTTILQALRRAGIDTPALCYHPNLTPINVCRICVVELAGSRALVPSCSRRVEAGMQIRTGTERVRRARKVVLELLASSVDTSTAPDLRAYLAEYGGDPMRFGTGARRVEEPLRDDNDLYVREYEKCILCYKCVEACGDDAQFTFALSVAGRGFAARIDPGADARLLDSRCVFCGNCVAVCPTGALMPLIEHRMRRAGEWDEARQRITETICPYCGVGCALELHVQDNRIVKVTSPSDHSVTRGHLCVKGRFGFTFVRPDAPSE